MPWAESVFKLFVCVYGVFSYTLWHDKSFNQKGFHETRTYQRDRETREYCNTWTMKAEERQGKAGYSGMNIVGWMRTKSNAQCIWNNNMKPSTDFLRPVECSSSSVHLAYHLKQVGLPDQLECQIPVLMTLTRYVNWRATEKDLNFEPFHISTLIHTYLCTHIHMNTCKTHRVVTHIRKWNENGQLFMYQLRKFWRTEPLTVSKKLHAEEENKYIRQGTNKPN